MSSAWDALVAGYTRSDVQMLGLVGLVVGAGLAVVARVWYLRRPPFREAPMVFRVGRPGSGKTLALCKAMIGRMRQGIPVYSNVPITDPVSGRRSGVFSSWTHLRQLTDRGLRNFTASVDEGNVLASSRKALKVPIWLLSWWAQRRHYGAEVWITAQHENRVDVVLRETVDLIVVCERVRWLPKWVPLFKETPCYPEELEALRGGKAAPSRYIYIPGYAYEGYDTAEIIEYDDMAENADPALLPPIVHPNYYPGVAFEMADLQDGWCCPEPLTDDEFWGWVDSEEGQERIRALASLR